MHLTNCVYGRCAACLTPICGGALVVHMWILIPNVSCGMSMGCAGVDVDTFLMDLDAVLELIRTLKSNVSDGHVILRPFSEAEKQTIFEVACRSFVFATSKVLSALWCCYIPQASTCK